MWLRDMSGKKSVIKELNFLVKIVEVKHYFGFLHQLPNTKGLISIIDKKTHLKFRSDDFLNETYKETFARFDSLRDIPTVPNSLRLISAPNELIFSDWKLEGPLTKP